MKKWVEIVIVFCVAIIIWFIINSIFGVFQACSGAPCYIGFPLKFIKPAGCGSCIGCPCYNAEINILNTIVDFIFWLIISYVFLYLFKVAKRSN
jgi:hypothetical protein